jgi:hypothetical protein
VAPRGRTEPEKGKGMGDAAAYAKRVLLTCNGGDDDAVSRGIATSLARHGCRY